MIQTSPSFVRDFERSEIPGFQASIYWYLKRRPLVSLNVWRWGLTLGWYADPTDDDMEIDVSDVQTESRTYPAPGWDMSGTNNDICPKCGQPIRITSDHPRPDRDETITAYCYTCNWTRVLRPVEVHEGRMGTLILMAK